MAKRKRKVKTKEKKKRVHRGSKGPYWVVEDEKVVRTHIECTRCGPGVYMAHHYNRYHCG
ncbi:MAG: hypothetical protein GF364_20685, partial [Candidatus Lokiarchaeota archaeon]|nr:hypothetical protein [Candidatus Lokiarchaeota archaeon]